MTDKQIAEKIVERLFRNGSNREASRLVLELPGEVKDGGGWCRAAVRDVIIDVLTESK